MALTDSGSLKKASSDLSNDSNRLSSAKDMKDTDKSSLHSHESGKSDSVNTISISKNTRDKSPALTNSPRATPRKTIEAKTVIESKDCKSSPTTGSSEFSTAPSSPECSSRLKKCKAPVSPDPEAKSNTK